MLTFFEGLPREITFPRPTLIGGNNDWEILFNGFSTTSRVIEQIRHLDEPFSRGLVLQKTLLSEKRTVPIKSPMATVYSSLRKGFDRLCLLDKLGGCSDTIVRAHSLQKSLLRKHAACDGHVYHFDPFASPKGSDQIQWPTRVGINEATTVTGFCSRHDAEIFAPIETKLYVGTDEQKFLFHYRAVAQAYYVRAHKMKIIRTAYDDLVKQVGASEAKWIGEKLQLNAGDIRDIERAKKRYDEMLEKKQYPQIATYSLLSDTIPHILATDFFAPQKDFSGRKIQHVKTLQSLNWVSLTILIVGDRGLVLLCAEPSNPEFEKLKQTLATLPQGHKTMALVTYIVCQFENFVILPRWWDSLRCEDQRNFVNARAASYYPRELPPVCDWKLT